MTAVHTPADLHTLAREAFERGDFTAAEASLGIAFELDDNDAEAMTIMADILEARDEPMEALGYAILAINTDGGKMDAKRKFLRLARNLTFSHHNPKIEIALLRCLETPGLDCLGAAELWGHALLINPGFGTIFVEVTRKRLLPWGGAFDNVQDLSPMAQPLFLLGLKRMAGGFRPFDELLMLLRRFLLQTEPQARKMPADDALALMLALARNMAAVNYALDISAKEEQALSALEAKIEAGAGTSSDIALFACYKPLHALYSADDILRRFAGEGELGMLVEAQLARRRIS